MIETTIHWYLNLFEKNKANVNGRNTAVARNPIDKNPKSLMNDPENVAATITDINNIPTIVSRDILRFFDDSLNVGFIFMKTSIAIFDRLQLFHNNLTRTFSGNVESVANFL